ncbi:hypothetical protein E1B28_012628 [Marasmius oreades]|uniref:Uncharacterized protein n=1 Tax=Marasmius oreades TaxID=181124 RepID=A0A9P7RSX8_9AGAR|nr:uncharacterized protein E1B28_012628 [Marasmius oreades]KAG7088656.1 hypothetical protein E1B28_012628 [Marasmius oreades]
MIFDPSMQVTFTLDLPILTYNVKLDRSNLASSSAWIPLLYDTIVFGLTINRALPSIRRKQAGAVLKKIVEDGLLYYSVIFCITLVLTIMIIGASDGVKNILAQTEQLVTVAMMSRITISLKKLGHKQEALDYDVLLPPTTSFFFERRKKSRKKEDIPLAFINSPVTPPPVHRTDCDQVCSTQSWPRESVL